MLDLRALIHPLLARLTSGTERDDAHGRARRRRGGLPGQDRGDALDQAVLGDRRPQPGDATGVGKALLAWTYPTDEALRAWAALFGPLPTPTHRTVTSVAQLAEQLAEVRDRGYALDIEENETGVRCAAVPIFLGRAGPGRRGQRHRARRARRAPGAWPSWANTCAGRSRSGPWPPAADRSSCAVIIDTETVGWHAPAWRAFPTCGTSFRELITWPSNPSQAARPAPTPPASSPRAASCTCPGRARCATAWWSARPPPSRPGSRWRTWARCWPRRAPAPPTWCGAGSSWPTWPTSRR